MNEKESPHSAVKDLNPGDYLYMLPKGRKGLFWDPEIKDVLLKYVDMGVDFSNENVQENFIKEVGEAIRALPLNPIVVDQPPVHRLDSVGNEYMTFPDGSTTEGMKFEA